MITWFITCPAASTAARSSSMVGVDAVTAGGVQYNSRAMRSQLRSMEEMLDEAVKCLDSFHTAKSSPCNVRRSIILLEQLARDNLQQCLNYSQKNLADVPLRYQTTNYIYVEDFPGVRTWYLTKLLCPLRGGAPRCRFWSGVAVKDAKHIHGCQFFYKQRGRDRL